MNLVTVVKDLDSFVFLQNPYAWVCNFLKRETAEEICSIDWRATWNRVEWPGMAVHNQLQMKEMKRKRKAYWMYWIILLCSQPRDWKGCVIGFSAMLQCVIRNMLDRRHLETHTWTEEYTVQRQFIERQRHKEPLERLFNKASSCHVGARSSFFQCFFLFYTADSHSGLMQQDLFYSGFHRRQFSQNGHHSWNLHKSLGRFTHKSSAY